MLAQIRQVRLPDRPFHTSVSGDGRRYVACSPEGRCRLFNEDLRQLDEIDLGAGVEWVQLDECGAMLLVGFSSHIDGFTASPNVSHSFKLAVSGTSFQSCVFRSDEQVLLIASLGDEPVISAWDLKAGAVIVAHALPYRDCAGYCLVPHPEGEAVAAVAYSGQSEEWMFWAHYSKGHLRVFERPGIEGVRFPVFHPTGREIVSSHESLGLCRGRFPEGDVIASVTSEEAFPDNPDDVFSNDIHFTGDDRFLVWQDGLALYEFDLTTLRPMCTILAGVEGMTFGEGRFFSGPSWRLADDRLLTTDCLHDARFRNRTDTLRLWDASSVFAPVSPPDPARPYTKRLLAGDASGSRDGEVAT